MALSGMILAFVECSGGQATRVSFLHRHFVPYSPIRVFILCRIS